MSEDTKRQREAQAVFSSADNTTRMINSYDLLKEYAKATGKPMPAMVSYRAEQRGRGYQSAAWQVLRPGWHGYARLGNKTFNVFERKNKEPQLAAAKEWAEKRYGVTEWKKTNRVRGARNDFFPAEVVDWLEATIAEWKKNHAE